MVKKEEEYDRFIPPSGFALMGIFAISTGDWGGVAFCMGVALIILGCVI
jgi:hypothetical protein